MPDSTYPTTIDTFVLPIGTDDVSVVDHALNHRKANDALLGLENLIGTNASQTTPTAAGYVLNSTSATASKWTDQPAIATSITVPLLIGGTGTTSPLTLRSTSGVGTTGADIIFQTGNNGATEAMRILNSGNVGIGTASPAAILDVFADTGVLAPVFTRKTSATGQQSAVQIGLTGNSTVAGAGPSFLFFSNNSAATKSFLGRLSAVWENGTAGSEAAGIVFSVRANSGDTNAATERLRISSSGNVGIGITNPASKLDITDTSLAGSGSLAGSVLNIAQTWNTTGVPTAIKLNVTNTASTGTPLLLDLQVATVSKFKVDSGGNITTPTSLTWGSGGVLTSSGGVSAFASSLIFWNGRGGFMASSDGNIRLTNNAQTDFSLLQFGGTTSSFPALKRSTTTLAVRLADDSADAGITASSGVFSTTLSVTGAINSSAAQTTYNGSVSGTAIWSMPLQGASWKKFIIYYNALHDAGGTITFPTAFVKTPTIYGDSAATGITTASTTTLTISLTALTSGFAIVEGY